MRSRKYRVELIKTKSTAIKIKYAHILLKLDNSEAKKAFIRTEISKSQKRNKTDHKDAKWIFDLFMCDIIKPSLIPQLDICHLRDLIQFQTKLTNEITGMKNHHALNCLTVSNLKLNDVLDPPKKICKNAVNYGKI